MKKIAKVLLAFLMIASVTACSSKKDETPVSSGTFTAGTYEGTSTGRNGEIKVEVTLSADAIESIVVTSSRETENIGTVATEKMPERIVEAQSLAVDYVSGATISSAAVKNAVKDALSQATEDYSAFESVVAYQENQEISDDASVVVVGGGGAGLAAAISAMQAGAESVIVIEKTDLLGGDTNVNGGIYNTPDEELQSKTEMTDALATLVTNAINEESVSEEHAALQAQLKQDYADYLASGKTGIFDSVAWYALQTWNGGDKVANLSLVETLAENAFSGYEWIESLGTQFKDTISQGPGSLYPRTHDTQTGIGAEFIDTYMNYIATNYSDKVTCYYGVEADTLNVDENGVVISVSGKDKHNNSYTFNATNGIVLATGGFAGNVDMRVEYCQSEKWPNLGSDVGTTGVASDTGDGIVMAEAIGAQLVDMDQIQLLHMCNPNNGTTDDNSAKNKGVSSIIFVNQEGNRFVAEDGRRDTISLSVLEQTGAIFYTIESWDGNGDATLDTLLTNNGVTYAEEIERGNMFYGETIEDLAEAIGADPENLRASIETYNQCVEDGATTDEFGRKTFVEKLETGPFLSVPRKPSAHHTMGGIAINENTEVLSTDNTVIKGLYAAGEVTGGIHGGNRLGGNAIVDTVVMGKIAGEQAAAFNK